MLCIKEIVYLLENWLSTPTTSDELDEWLLAAEEICDGFELSAVEQRYMDAVLDMYEEQFKCMIGLKKDLKKDSKKDALLKKDALSSPMMTSFANTICSVSPFLTSSTNYIYPMVTNEMINELLGRTQTEQRTEEWYKQMTTIISASELGNLFGSPYQRSKFVISKTKPYQRRQQDLAVSSSRMSAFDWGIRFEPVVKQIYEHIHSATVKELGRMIHQVDPRCTASPDGLVYASTNPAKIGRLIEIKCPVTREINNTIPKDYYHQMQMQLHVTGLYECDYVEASFSSQYNQEPMKEGPCLYYGQIALVRRAQGREFYYSYSPIQCEDDWQPMTDVEEDIIEIIPWRLYQWSENVVQRNEEWWKTTHPLIEEFWQDVEKHKRGEFATVESTRPTKKQKPNQDACMITFTRLDY